MTDGPVWLNGALCPAAEAKVDALSQAVLQGAGVYDALLLHGGRPVAFDKHLRRLTIGAQRLQLPPPDGAALRAAIATLAAAHRLTEARVRITLGSGRSPNVFPGPDEVHVTLVTLSPVAAPKATAALTISAFRRNEHSPLAGIKYTACAENLLVQRAALAAGFDEAVFLNTAGDVCEGAFSNVFIVSGDRVHTPSLTSGCLPGVAREIVLELCARHSIPADETTVAPAALADADEIFLTSSIRGIQPVRRIDSRELLSPGSLTQRLMAHYASWLGGE
jgi:branched-chain amino acid aminotransferase